MEVSAAAAAAANLYASRHLGPLFSLNNNGLPFGTGQSMGSFQSLPFFLPAAVPPSLYPAANHQDIADMKERLQKELIRGLQLTSGGSLLDPRGAAGQLRAFHNQVIADSARNKEALKMEIKESSVDVKPLVKPLPPSPLHNNNNMNSNNNSIKTGRDRDAPGAVKMVIKNGVLMPKQKQRRYRTERPFACEHCSARFTLRSNMERHVKQQHPQFWSQRQRGTTPVVNGPGRRPTVNVPIPPLPQHLPLPVTQPKIEPLDEKKPIIPSPVLSSALQISSPIKEDDKSEEDNNNKTFISDEVRLLIAQQLKSKLGTSSPEPVEEEEGDGELVIDEEKAAEEESAAPPVSSSPLVAAVSSSSSSSTSSSPTAISAASPVTTTAPSVAPAAPAKTASSAARPEPEPHPERKDVLEGGSADLASVSRLLDNASTQTQAFQQYFRGTQDAEEFGREEGSEEDEEGLVAGSNSEGNNSGSDENKSESEAAPVPGKKKSAYSLAPNRVSCPFCYRKFPWSSSLRRHVLTHTGQKPFKCPHCPLLFTTKSNCDRHLLRKHSNNNNNNNNNNSNTSNSNSTSISNTTGSNTSSSGSGNETSPGSLSSNTSSAAANSSNNYTMRNVPERPYKCNYCPSSTFATLSNLRKHVASKHSNSSSGSSPPTSPIQQTLPPPGPGSDASDPSGASSHYEESHCGSGSEDGETERRPSETADTPHNPPLPPPPTPIVATPVRDVLGAQPAVSTNVSSGGSASSELPFKCHLCDGGYADRQDALDHIRDVHPAEFELLMSKGALDTAAEDNAHVQHTSSSASQNHEESSPTADENIEQLRGRFPDYANRKVMCAFCMRRFWSAEDLRRHMRTHTGERPFSCDICRRRFTLKHSMLRHRKKHAAGGSLAIPPVGTANTQTEDGISVVSGDEDAPEPQASPPSSSVTSGFAVTNHNNNNIITNSAMTKVAQHRLLVEGANTEEETDLIGNLLGIQDKSIIDKMLQSKSADDAAKLLGVKNGSQE